METQRDNSYCSANASEQCSSNSKSQQVDHYVKKPSQIAEMVVISSDDEVEIIGVNNRPEHEGGNNDKPTGCNSPSKKDTTCSVCLSEYDNKAFLDRCFHAFCYFCILQWSEVVHTCPLCKSGFSSIIHSVKSMDNYQQHFLSKPGISIPTCQQQSQNTGGRFRYRTTLVEGRRSQLQTNRRQQPEQVADAWGQRARQRHTYLSSQRNRTLMARERRRTIYSSNLWVQQITQEGRPRQRDISPAFFRANPACCHRLIPWLTRELRVLLNDEETHVNFVLQILLSLITKIEITSDEFCKQLLPFLFGKTEHFIHEFKSFAQSPFDIIAYDERAQYNWLSESRQSRTDTPSVFHSETAGWQTPDVVPGPSGISMQELSRTDWVDDSQARESSSWSPRSSPGTPRLNASRCPEVVESETAPLDAVRSSTSVDISLLSSSPRTRIDDESVPVGERIDSLSVQASNDNHHRHYRKHKHRDKRKKHLNEDPVRYGRHPVERSSERAEPSRISLDSSSPGPSIDVITVSSDGVFTPDALRVNKEDDIRETIAPSSARYERKASHSGSSKCRGHRDKRSSPSASRYQSKFRSRFAAHSRDETTSRARSRSRCKKLKHERDEDRSRRRSRSDSHSRSQRRSRSRCKNLTHEGDEDRSRRRSRCSWHSRSRTPSESHSRAEKEHIEKGPARCSEQQYRSRSYLHSRSRTRAENERGSRLYHMQRNHTRYEAELSSETSASLWREENKGRAPSSCSSEKKGAEASLCRSIHTKSHSRKKHSRCQSRSSARSSRSRRSRSRSSRSRSSRSRLDANSRSQERSASRSRARRSVSETNESVRLSNEDIEKEIKDLEFRIAIDKKRLLQLLIKQEKTAEVSDSGRDEGDRNVAQPDQQTSLL